VRWTVKLALAVGVATAFAAPAAAAPVRDLTCTFAVPQLQFSQGGVSSGTASCTSSADELTAAALDVTMTIENLAVANDCLNDPAWVASGSLEFSDGADYSAFESFTLTAEPGSQLATLALASGRSGYAKVETHSGISECVNWGSTLPTSLTGAFTGVSCHELACRARREG
jgi:hypothetical protein